MLRRRKRAAGDGARDEPPHDVFLGLRAQAFGAEAEGLAPPPRPDHPDVWGAVMEMRLAGGIASLVTLADGTTSLYTSTGGGIIGGGAHPPVVEASHRFLVGVQEHLGDLEPEDRAPLPSEGSVRFHALTPSGRLSAEAGEADLLAGRHELAPLFRSAHEVITALRMIEEAAPPHPPSPS
jgi:hypothetical protein